MSEITSIGILYETLESTTFVVSVETSYENDYGGWSKSSCNKHYQARNWEEVKAVLGSTFTDRDKYVVFYQGAYYRATQDFKIDFRQKYHNLMELKNARKIGTYYTPKYSELLPGIEQTTWVEAGSLKEGDVFQIREYGEFNVIHKLPRIDGLGKLNVDYKPSGSENLCEIFYKDLVIPRPDLTAKLVYKIESAK